MQSFPVRTFTFRAIRHRAAFLAAAALIVPGSDIVIEGVLTNPTRTGLYLTLKEMGGDVTFLNEREEGGEPVADIRVRASASQGSQRSTRACAVDDRRVSGACSNFSVCRGTNAHERTRRAQGQGKRPASGNGCRARGDGATVRVDGDTLMVEGTGGLKGGGTVATHLDHRIAMAFLTAGLASETPIIVDDSTMIATSFPEFRPIMEALGAGFTEPVK